MLRKEKVEAFVSSIRLDLKPQYTVEVAAKFCTVGYITPQFQKFDERQANSREHFTSYLDFMELTQMYA